ncbi:hypothetical protein HYV84_05245 [Candidatus Woesearchaeota archaeon]|nr:hypothetical protein [Candidatus Woesearchaeota archaeon]
MRGQLETYEGFCEKFFDWNFHLVLITPKRLAVVTQHNSNLGERVKKIFAQQDRMPRDYFP